MNARCHRGHWRTVVALCAAIVSITLPGCSRSPSKAATPSITPLAVRTGTVESRTLPRIVEVPGTVRPVDRAVLAPRVMGMIEALPVGLGSVVRRGDTLVRISARDIAARVEQAEARLSQISGDWKRESTLLASGASTSEAVRTLDTQQRSAEAALDEARTLLGYTTIVAPFDGTITRRLANEGDLAAPGVPLLEIEGSGRLRVEAEVPESLAMLQPGLQLRIKAGTQDILEGTLAEISPSADTNSRTALAKIDLSAGTTTVRSGQFVRAEIPAAAECVIVAPVAAVTNFGQLERVFLVTDGHVQLRLVRTGTIRGDVVEILAGLAGGETVVLSPPTVLSDGFPVAPQP
jgi:membrane fusion protein, multidrug efflux system